MKLTLIDMDCPYTTDALERYDTYYNNRWCSREVFAVYTDSE